MYSSYVLCAFVLFCFFAAVLYMLSSCDIDRWVRYAFPDRFCSILEPLTNEHEHAIAEKQRCRGVCRRRNEIRGDRLR